LTDLHRALSTTVESLLQIQTDLDRPYHPHMSVAFRDLSRLHFAKAWEYYSQLSYEREFALKEIYLLRHNGREWEEYGMFKFTGNPN
jgi:2'-5' RNA ligase